MKIFKIGRGINVICQSESTRYGFRHLATLQVDNYRDVLTAKCCYYNRTWERYTFESVLENLEEKSREAGSLSAYHQAKFKRLIKNNWQKKASDESARELKTVGMVMAMGSLLTKGQGKQNDWKTRMLKAGLGNKGLIMPEDWDQLNEAEKTKRLDKVQQHLTA